MNADITNIDAWKGIADCASCGIRDSVLFAGLEHSDFDKIHTPITQETYQPGQVLYHEGGKADYLFTVRKGLVKLVNYLPDGGRRIVRLVRCSDLVGMEALLNKPYSHDAVVLQTTDVCRLPASVIHDLKHHNQELNGELLSRWQRALEQADLWLARLSTGSARQRVARLLLWLNEFEPESTCHMIGREDMGAVLSITTETASRTVAEFKRQGLITDQGRQSHICDLGRLKQIADG